MSLTSCYTYVVALPAASLTQLLQSVIAQGETASIPTTIVQNGVAVDGGYTADVAGRLVSEPSRPAEIRLTAVDLQVLLTLFMDLTVTITNVPGLDPLQYELDFELAGVFTKDSAVNPPMLTMDFSAMTAAQLNLVVRGGTIPLTPGLFEGSIHDLYLNHALYNEMQTAWYITRPGTNLGGTTYFVKVWIYDDDPASPTQRGGITVSVVDVDTIAVRLPARIHALDISSNIVYDINFDVGIRVDIVEEPTVSGGVALVARLSQVDSSDIDIVNVVVVSGSDPFGLVAAGVSLFVRPEILAIVQTLDDEARPIVDQASVKAIIENALLSYAASQHWPIFPLGGSAAAGEVDLSSTVPATVAAQALALQVEPLADGTVCDAVDLFTAAADFAVAISRVRVQQLLTQIEDSLAGRDLDFGGYDVTMRRPHATLSDAGAHGQAQGHIWVEGDVVVHVGGCVGDVDAQYWGGLRLAPVRRMDGTLGFDVIAENFGGDADAKDKKDDFDPHQIENLIGNMEFPIPIIPTRFEGVGTIDLNYTTAEISSQGIVLRGGVAISLLNVPMLSAILPSTMFWALEPSRDD